jgi:hypothetical protein
MIEAVRTSETSVDNHFTRQYNPEDSSEHVTEEVTHLFHNHLLHEATAVLSLSSEDFFSMSLLFIPPEVPQLNKNTKIYFSFFLQV